MHFFSRGKILLSGEYLVLFGARALALPSRLGQHLYVHETPGSGTVRITSKLNGDEWFSCVLDLPRIEVRGSSEEIVSDFVRDLFIAAKQMRPGLLAADRGYILTSELEFDTRWGLGSSSSLISNLAYWLDVDPFELFWKISQGSGFDIACARASRPLVYWLENDRPNVEAVPFEPSFKDNLYFVYLGHKQDSQYSVKDFRERFRPDRDVNRKITGITDQMVSVNDIKEFEKMITEHEAILSSYLDIPTIKSSRFPGFQGSMKSLGAWGGDLVLVTWKEEEEVLRKYFNARGLHLVFRYNDLI